MIQYELFDLAAPPRVGGAWLMRACERAGVPAVGGDGLHNPPGPGYAVGVIRHPFTWLQSYYAAGGPTFHSSKKSTVLLSELVKQSASMEIFFRNYLTYIPGTAGEAMLEYKVDTILRMEDYPWNAFEFLASVGVPERTALEAVRDLPPSNPGP